MVGLCGPACRFVYPDVIKSYFVENIPCSLHICTLRQKTGCGKVWSQQAQVPSRLFQKPASRRPFREKKRQKAQCDNAWPMKTSGHLRNPALFSRKFSIIHCSVMLHTSAWPLFY